MKEITILSVITVSNCREDYKGGFTKEEEQIIKEWIRNSYTLNLFSGMSELGNIRIDLNFDSKATNFIDVFEFIQDSSIRNFQSIIIDPPYNERYMKIYTKNQKQKSDFVIFADTRRTTLLFNWIKLIHPEQIILKSFQFYRFEGYNVKGYITYAGGYRKPIFLLNNVKKGI